MGKGLIKILFSLGILFLPLVSASNIQNEIFPVKFQKFKSYKKRAKFKYTKSKIFRFMGINRKLKLEYYDITGDKRGDVLEIYEYKNYKFPCIYGFDSNDNGNFERDELIKDKLRDGLNGNEQVLTPWEYSFKDNIKDI